jgi:hypothetical protein
MTAKTWKSTWASVTAYAVGDIVDRSGKLYTCTRAHKSTATFDPAEWAVYVPTVAEVQAGTALQHVKTDSEFTTEFPSIISAISTAVASGLYSTKVNLSEIDYYTIKLNLELKGYTVTTNRTGYGVTSATLKPVTISWVKYSIPTQFA